MRERGGRRGLQECLECRCADLNGWEGEGIYIEKRENRFADIENEIGGAVSKHVGPATVPVSEP